MYLSIRRPRDSSVFFVPKITLFIHLSFFFFYTTYLLNNFPCTQILVTEFIFLVYITNKGAGFTLV